MIKLERVRTRKAISIKFRDSRGLNHRLRLLEAIVTGSKPDKQYWRTAKDQLRREAHEKCAYCEAATALVAHGDVEHFRPVSKYPWLAFCYDNYLYACQICNQVHKLDNFPVEGVRIELVPPLPDPFDPLMDEAERLRIVQRFAPDPLDHPDSISLADFRAAADAEQAHLPDPYNEDPEPIFRWEPDPVLKEVAAAPRDNSPWTTKRFTAAEQFLGLNREELRRWRWRTYTNLDAWRTAILTDGAPQEVVDLARMMLREMIAPDAPFAGMARYFVSEVWRIDLQGSA